MSIRGTRVCLVGARPHQAAQIAKAFNANGLELHQLSQRNMWEFPKSGRPGESKAVGAFRMSFVCVYYDGYNVFLEMVGPRVPKDSYEFTTFRENALKIKLTAKEVELASGVEFWKK